MNNPPNWLPILHRAIRFININSDFEATICDSCTGCSVSICNYYDGYQLFFVRFDEDEEINDVYLMIRAMLRLCCFSDSDLRQIEKGNQQ